MIQRKELYRYFVVMFMVPAIVFSAGKLKGTVVDSLTKEPMVGANIFLVGTSIGSVTDIYGAYILPSVPAGTYTIRCSYVGYHSKEQSVSITEGVMGEIKFSIVADIVQGQEVVISAQAFGQAAAINQQLNSNTIVNVISEQKIKELPDANAAEAIGRLPGVSLVRSGGEASKIILRGLGDNMTTVTVDGVKLSPTDPDSRGIDLSVISQGSLSGIELSKAITSDMDGEAIAGNVNFVTKIAPETMELQFDSYGIYNWLDKTYNQYNFVGRYGQRFFDGLFGLQIFGNIEKRDRSNEQYSVGYLAKDGAYIPSLSGPRRTYLISSLGLQYTGEERNRKGAKVLLDLKPADDVVIRLNGEFSRTDRDISVVDRNFPTYGGDVGYNFHGQEIQTDIKNIALQGKQYLMDLDVDWSLSYSESGSEAPYDYAMHFTEASTLDSLNRPISGMLAISDPSILLERNYEKIIPYGLTNYNATYINRAEARTTSSLDIEKTAFINAKANYRLFDVDGEFKFGGKYRSKYHRRVSTMSQALYYNSSGFYSSVKLPNGTVQPKDYSRYGYTNIIRNSGLILMPNFVGGTRTMYGNLLLNPMISSSRIRDWYDMNIDGFNPVTNLNEYDNDNSVKGSDYSLTESVFSEYAMNILKFGDVVTLITGVRVETDKDDYTAYFAKQEVTRFSTFEDTTTTHKETIVLPNFQAIIKPTDFLNVRLAAYKGINRPDFNFRLPTYYYGFSVARYGDSKKVIVAGNTDLKNAVAWNYEVSLQFYGNDIGLLSLSAFGKKIDNLVSTVNYLQITDKKTLDSLHIGTVPGISYANLLVSAPYNSSHQTKVWGFELEHQANLKFLPGYLSHIVLSYNVTLSKTETYATEQLFLRDSVYDPLFETYIYTSKQLMQERKTKIPNAPEWFGNLSVGYDIGDFSGRIAYFYQRQYVRNLSSDNRSNVYQKSFDRLDLSLKQKLTEMISVGLNVNNLTNSSEGDLFSDDAQGWQGETVSYRYGTSAELWLKISL